jgi:hypothetical protein
VKNVPSRPLSDADFAEIERAVSSGFKLSANNRAKLQFVCRLQLEQNAPPPVSGNAEIKRAKEALRHAKELSMVLTKDHTEGDPFAIFLQNNLSSEPASAWRMAIEAQRIIVTSLEQTVSQLTAHYVRRGRPKSQLRDFFENLAGVFKDAGSDPRVSWDNVHGQYDGPFVRFALAVAKTVSERPEEVIRTELASSWRGGKGVKGLKSVPPRPLRGRCIPLPRKSGKKDARK